MSMLWNCRPFQRTPIELEGKIISKKLSRKSLYKSLLQAPDSKGAHKMELQQFPPKMERQKIPFESQWLNWLMDFLFKPARTGNERYIINT